MAKAPEKFGVSIKGFSDTAVPADLKAFNRYLDYLRATYPEKKDLLPCGEIEISNAMIFRPSSGSIGTSTLGGSLGDFLASLRRGIDQNLGIQSGRSAENSAPIPEPAGPVG